MAVEKSGVDAALEALVDGVERDGVGVVSVQDGKFLMFSKGSLERLLARIEGTGKDRIIIFVKDQKAS